VITQISSKLENALQPEHHWSLPILSVGNQPDTPIVPIFMVQSCSNLHARWHSQSA